VLGGLILLSPQAFGQSGGTKITYKLNVAKSVYRAGQQYQSSTLTIELDGEWIITTVDPVTTTGERTHAQIRFKSDGMEYPVTGSLPDGADTVVTNQLDVATTERIDKRAGQVVSKVISVSSPDRSTLTVTHKGIRPDGQPFDHTIVYERQQ
jgi:hypothetical protein